MSDLTVSEFREHFETDLPDDAIQRVIDSVEDEVTKMAGPVGQHTYVLNGGGKYLFFLNGPILSIDSIEETVGDTVTTLDATDYRLVDGGYYAERLYRLALNPRYTWGRQISVTVTHPPASPKRKLTTIDIVKGELQYNGVAQESAGGYNVSMGDWLKTRTQLLRSISAGLPLA